ncbi:MAG: hypothetical protein VB099_11170 [Candidatus Limiplasma sp.]|nr:hypothetical protein [Candidatus Limiplasma sp.]
MLILSAPLPASQLLESIDLSLKDIAQYYSSLLSGPQNAELYNIFWGAAIGATVSLASFALKNWFDTRKMKKACIVQIRTLRDFLKCYYEIDKLEKTLECLQKIGDLAHEMGLFGHKYGKHAAAYEDFEKAYRLLIIDIESSQKASQFLAMLSNFYDKHI